MKAIQTELEAIQEATGGMLRPSDVVKRARIKESAMHNLFTWNDGEAAHQYRLEQARKIIRVQVTILPQEGKQKGKRIRTFVSLANDRADVDGGYRKMVDVLSDDELRAQMLDEALRVMNKFAQKYHVLKELSPVFAAVEKVEVQRTQGKKKAAAGRAMAPV